MAWLPPAQALARDYWPDRRRGLVAAAPPWEWSGRAREIAPALARRPMRSARGRLDKDVSCASKQFLHQIIEFGGIRGQLGGVGGITAKAQGVAGFENF